MQCAIVARMSDIRGKLCLAHNVFRADVRSAHAGYHSPALRMLCLVVCLHHSCQNQFLGVIWSGNV
jgi:hypothetical protein